MKIISLLLLASTANQAFSQDPTVPSPALLQRLNSQVASASTTDSVPNPKIKLKAMVMSTSNRGIAILEADGQRFQLRLERPDAKNNSLQAGIAANNQRLQIQGVEYSLIDFHDRTIILSDSVRSVIVQ